MTFQATRLSGSDALAVRASKKLRSEELLVTSLGPTILRKHLDDVPLWPEGRVSVRQLIDYFATYIYLPRLAGPDVLLGAIKGGLALLTWPSESFAYADSFDEAAGRYRGLRAGQNVPVTADSTGLLVKSDIACRQLDAEAPTLDVDALFRGLVVSERALRWLGGSVAAAIWVFRELQKRDYRLADRAAEWAIARTDNPYVPFGRQHLGARNLSEYQRLRGDRHRERRSRS